MKKILALVIALVMVVCTAAALADGIKVGIINNPPSESGYREANVKSFESVFSAENGYDVQTKYTGSNDEQVAAARQFVTDGVDYLLISAAETTGWESVLQDAQKEVPVRPYDRRGSQPVCCRRRFRHGC